MTALEIAITGIDGLRAAHAAGADRVELCAALETGGLTPSIGMVDLALSLSLLPVHVLIRPRPGDFIYDEDEISTMVRDIERLRALGAAGCVIGALTSKGAPDTDTLSRLADAAAGLHITWHRMVDVLLAPSHFVPLAIQLGASRILSSGGAQRAADGIPELARMVNAAGERVEIMAGGGVGVDAIAPLLTAGISAIHLSGSRRKATGPTGPGGGPATRLLADPILLGLAARTLRQLDEPSSSGG